MTGSVIDTRLQSITVNIFLQRSFVERECFYIFLSSTAFNDVRSTVCVVECEFSQTASVDHSGLRMFEATESNAFRNEETKNSGTQKICCICHSPFSIRGNPTRNEWYWKYLYRDSTCSFQTAVFSGILFFDRNIFPLTISICRSPHYWKTYVTWKYIKNINILMKLYKVSEY